jgi:uncharacterized protein (DUF486 family)
MPVALRSTLLLVCSNVFMMFAVLYMRQPARLDFLCSALCMCGVAYFVFRS